MTDLTFRPLVAGEFDLFSSYGPAPATGVGARRRTFEELVADGQYRPEWVWIAQRGDTVVARAAFWAPPGFDQPFSLDFFDPGHGDDHVEVGGALLRAAYAALLADGYRVPTGNDRPDYQLFLPADWRERPDATADSHARTAAAEHAGLRFFVERLNYRWTPECGLPARSTRLRFEPAADSTSDALVVNVLARLCENTLDAYAKRDVDRYGVRKAAEVTVEETMEMCGDRDWWRLGYDPAGDVVGIVLPVRANEFATLAYVGVVPEHRGNRYSEDLVVEALHLFTEAGETVVVDATDVANVPMAAAFERIGYQLTGRRIVMH